MATIKAYTDIPQSKKLAEILPLESADMIYHPIMDIDSMSNSGFLDIPECYSFDEFKNSNIKPLPCWSLAALLGVLPTKLQIALVINDFQGDRKEKYAIGSVEHDRYDCFADNPIDVAYELIIRLNELNLL